MKIVVCLKQVPDMESRFKIIDNIYIDESQISFRINDFDLYAVELALQLREAHGGEVIIVSAGPGRVAKDIRQAFAMGADWGIHINDPLEKDADENQIAAVLKSAIEKIGGVDLVLAGVQSEDHESGITGGLVAAKASMPHATNIVQAEFDSTGNLLKCTRELEGGIREKLSIPLPAVISIQSGINTPRYPTLPGIMKAKKKQLDEMTYGDLTIDQGNLTERITLKVPEQKHKAFFIEGSPEEMAETLIDKLKHEAKVI